MLPSPVPQLRRALVPILALSLVLTPLAIVPAHSASPASASVDLDWHLNRSTEHYTRAADGTEHLTLYNSPAGVPDPQGWRLRDPRLGAPDARGKVAPATLPFTLSIATRSDATTLADLVSEDDVTLGVGLVAINGVTPAAITGHVVDNAVTFPSPIATAPSDVAVRATASGVDVRFTLHKPTDGNQFTLALVPDPRTQLTQDGSEIEEMRPVTQYADNGAAQVITQTEFQLRPPLLLDGSADPAARVVNGPITATLGATSTGQPTVTYSVDPAWLSDARRTFPVHLDVPIVTAYAAVQSGIAATVDSCAPDTAAPPTGIVVGVQGSCAYNGQLLFATPSIITDTAIASAILRLYTPDAAGPTGVQVYPNAPISETARWQTPTWDTAPAITGTVSIAQSASDGHWQSWDITDIVRDWIKQPWTNGGLTLKASGAPVLFAVPLGAYEHGVDMAPQVEITYAPRATAMMQPLYSDGAPYIYGIDASWSYPNAPFDAVTANCNVTYVVCPSHAVNINYAGTQTNGLAAKYIRIHVPLSCNNNGTPGPGYWGYTQNYQGFPTVYTGNEKSQDIYTLMSKTYNDGAIPIVQFVPNTYQGQSNCNYGYAGTGLWNAELQNFAQYMPSTFSGKFMYFEIGNEPNANANLYPYGYAADFTSAGQGLMNGLNFNSCSCFSSVATNWRLMTGGFTTPTANTSNTCYNYNFYAQPNDAKDSITHAEIAGIPPANLAVGVHPYGYDTGDPGYWRNYYHDPQANYDQSPAGACFDLGLMIGLYTRNDPVLSKVPLVMDEINWCGTCTTTTFSTYHRLADNFLVDLFTYLSDNGYTSSGQVRALWYSAYDQNNNANTSLYNVGSDPSQYLINEPISSGSYYEPRLGEYLPYCTNTNVSGQHPMSSNYQNLRSPSTVCY